jgi:anti-sigma factor RsiW
MPTRCEEVADALPAILDNRRHAGRGVIDHVEACLRCQAELARYRRMLRLLHQLGEESIELPAGALREVLDSVGRAAKRQAIRSALTGRRLAYASGLVGAIAAGIGAVALTRSRSTRTARTASGS